MDREIFSLLIKQLEEEFRSNPEEFSILSDYNIKKLEWERDGNGVKIKFTPQRLITGVSFSVYDVHTKDYHRRSTEVYCWFWEKPYRSLKKLRLAIRNRIDNIEQIKNQEAVKKAFDKVFPTAYDRLLLGDK